MNYSNLSHTISHALRHAPQEYGLSLDSLGFVQCNELFEALGKCSDQWKNLTIDDIEAAMANSTKRRFEIVGSKIRATYGHSVPGVCAGELREPPEYLYHGTTADAARLIAAEGLKPTYVYPDYISFEHNPQTVFEAGNQYRRFNTSNFYFQSENLAHIRQTDESFEIDITTCEARARKAYATYEDIHGEKFIYVENDNLDNATEADYCRVNFFYQCEAPLTHEDLYIMGALNDWCFNKSNLMRYDYRLHGYTCSMVLKQGYYNFMFVTIDRKTGEVMTDLTEGNYWETNNVYKLYFYFYNALKGYDELIGYATVNSH